MQIIESEPILCGDCKNPMVTANVIKTNQERASAGKPPMSQRYRVFGCQTCGGSSFWSKYFDGSVVVEPVSSDITLDVLDSKVDESQPKDGLPRSISHKIKLVKG